MLSMRRHCDGSSDVDGSGGWKNEQEVYFKWSDKYSDEHHGECRLVTDVQIWQRLPNPSTTVSHHEALQ